MTIPESAAATSPLGYRRLPGFTAESSVTGAMAYRGLFVPNFEADVISAGSEICNAQPARTR